MLVRILIAIFLITSVSPPGLYAGEPVIPLMPVPGRMVSLSPSFVPAHLTGIIIHPDNALQFDFLIHKGDGQLDEAQKKQEYKKLVKYFLASLTIPDDDQWVNLSPYEHNRIIERHFGQTAMGRDLLSQDYLLKEITSSLMYPESGLGKTFWDKVYARAWSEYRTTNIPVNTFNKVWIVPDEAMVYESGNTAYILKSHLKVMLEEDYLSLQKHTAGTVHTLGSQIIKEIILPEIEKEVNEGKNFATLRQIYSGMVLATWYKRVLKESLLGKVYANKAKVRGIDQDPQNNEAIYKQYLAAFKKGVYNYIKEDVDKYSQQSIPRKYFAGGFQDKAEVVHIFNPQHRPDPAAFAGVRCDFAQTAIDQVGIKLNEKQDAAMMTRRRFLGGGAALGAMAMMLPQALQGQYTPDIPTNVEMDEIFDAQQERIIYTNQKTDSKIYADGSTHKARQVLEIIKDYQHRIFPEFFSINGLSKGQLIGKPFLMSFDEFNDVRQKVQDNLIRVMGEQWKPASPMKFETFMFRVVAKYLAQKDINIILTGSQMGILPMFGPKPGTPLVAYTCYEVEKVVPASIKMPVSWGGYNR